jgi:hypothetical protein
MTASTLLAAATTIMVALVVLRLVRSIAEGDPVALGSRALVTTGWIELVGGTLATWVGNVGDWFASMDLFWLHGWSAVDVDPDVDLRQLGWPAAAPLHLDVHAGPLDRPRPHPSRCCLPPRCAPACRCGRTGLMPSEGDAGRVHCRLDDCWPAEG